LVARQQELEIGRFFNLITNLYDGSFLRTAYLWFGEDFRYEHATLAVTSVFTAYYIAAVATVRQTDTVLLHYKRSKNQLATEVKAKFDIGRLI